MNDIDIPIEYINDYLSKHPLEGTFMPGDEYKFKVLIKLGEIRKYIVVGQDTPHIEYTITTLPTNTQSDLLFKLYGDTYGTNIKITTRSREYTDLIFAVRAQLENLLIYFGVDYPSICTRVINKVGQEKIDWSLITEDKYDSVVRQIVRDILAIFKKHGKGEFGLPEDLRSEEVFYEFTQFKNPFQVFVDMSVDENVEGFDVDADFLRDEDLIYITLITNPKFGSSYFYDLVGELNELVRHELEHVKQFESGYKFPSKEPKNPLKYYTQPHELVAQNKGFLRRKKISGLDYETVVRNWFRKNKQKHRLTPRQEEIVIQKILKEK